MSYCPDEPNPLLPLAESARVSSTHSTGSYRATIIYAIRSPAWIV